MEEIYDPINFLASDRIDLNEHYLEYLEKTYNTNKFPLTPLDEDEDPIKADKKHLKTFKAICNRDISEEEYEQLKANCSIDLLQCQEEKPPIEVPEKLTIRAKIPLFLPQNEKANTLRLIREKKKMEKMRTCEQMLSWSRLGSIIKFPTKHTEPDQDSDLKAGENFIVNIFLFKPFKYNFNEKNCKDNFKFSHEICCLGSNKLTEFRDCIQCVSDAGLRVETEQPVCETVDVKAMYPSGFFFIDGVFYNDMRASNAIDYSEVIINWAEDKKIGTFTTADMDSVRIRDLTVRFGYPYLYQHQGNCEHIIIFADAHILSPNDCLVSNMYPRINSINRTPGSSCNMCINKIAKWLVVGYSRLPSKRTFLCTRCCKSYCYKDDEKIGEFQLYPLWNIISANLQLPKDG